MAPKLWQDELRFPQCRELLLSSNLRSNLLTLDISILS
jgi:hypothetical protein